MFKKYLRTLFTILTLSLVLGHHDVDRKQRAVLLENHEHLLEHLVISAKLDLMEHEQNREKREAIQAHWPCLDSDIVEKLAKLRVYSPESVILIAVRHPVRWVCHKLTVTLQEIKEYLNSCDQKAIKDTYIRFIRGLQTVYQEICVDKCHPCFETYGQCFHKIESEFLDCVGPSDWITIENNSELCKVKEQILDCLYVKNGILCGDKAASCMDELAEEILAKQLNTTCKHRRTPKISQLTNAILELEQNDNNTKVSKDVTRSSSMLSCNGMGFKILLLYVLKSIMY